MREADRFVLYMAFRVLLIVAPSQSVAGAIMDVSQSEGMRKESGVNVDVGICTRRVVIFLVLIVFGGMLLRLYHAAAKDLFYDEVFTYDVARKPIPELISELAVDTSPPLYFLLLKGWISLSSSYENIKSFPVLLGLLGIISGYFLGSSLFGRQIGLLTALLIALSPFHVRYSQELRMYTLYPALLSLGGSCVVWALRSGRARYWWLFAIFNALALYTHYHAFFFIAAVYAFLVLWIVHGKDRRALIWSIRSLFILLALLVPLVPLLMEQIANSLGKISWLSTPRLLDLPRVYLIGFIYYFEAMPESAWMWLISGVLFFVLIVFKARNRKRGGEGEWVYFLYFAGFLPIIAMFLLSFSEVKFFYIYRYVIISLIPFLALVAYGIYNLRWNILRLSAFGGFMIIDVLFTVMQNEQNYKPRWRTLTRVIDSRIKPNDVIIGNPGFYMNGYYFYSQKDHPILHFREVVRRFDFNPDEFYFLQFNAEQPEDALFPRLLPDVLRRISDMRELYSDWWFTLSWHQRADFPELRRWYSQRRRIGKANLPSRKFLYFVEAADDSLESLPGFAAPQIDHRWEAYRWIFGAKVALPLPGALPEGSYRLWIKCNLEYPKKIEDYKLEILLDGLKVYEQSGARGEQVVSATLDFQKSSAYPQVEFVCMTWVPKEWEVNEDERALAFRFYWLGIEPVVGEKSVEESEATEREASGKTR